MEISTIVENLIIVLTPALPYLTQFGGYAVQEIGEKLGEEAWKQASAVWHKLWLKVSQSSATSKAIQGILKDPEDQQHQAAFRTALEGLLREDTNLATEIADLLKNNAVTQLIEVEGKVGKDVKQRASNRSGAIRQNIKVQKGATVSGSVEQEV